VYETQFQKLKIPNVAMSEYCQNSPNEICMYAVNI